MLNRGQYAALFLVCPALAYAQSLGDSAQDLYNGPVSILALMLVWICYVVGAAFCIGAFMQLRIHFQNPKVVPLLTPVVMIIAGLALILLPYFSELDSNTASPVVQNAKGPYRPAIPHFSAENPGVQQSGEATYQVEPSNGGHWADDPRYH